MRGHPEEGLRILQRPARHHRLPGRAGDEEGHAPQTVGPNAAADSPTGYGPSDLQSAHGLASAASASGSGRTIAIVDAYDDPNAESDLANTHDSQALMPLSGASRRSAPPRPHRRQSANSSRRSGLYELRIYASDLDRVWSEPSRTRFRSPGEFLRRGRRRERPLAQAITRQGRADGAHGARGVQWLLHAGHHAGEAGAQPTGTPRHSEGMRNSNSGRSHGTAGGFASAVPVRTAPTRW